jgi:Ser/Thr protein kinase RdoA (MazF antagonist)
MDTELTPFASLTPDFILQAIDSLGLRTDGRLQALNSYENRVYQVGLEEDIPVIVKFYRPQRWTDQAILEEHQFLKELHDQEIPVVPPMAVRAEQTLYTQDKFYFSVFPKQAGHAPELIDAEDFAWMGRFIGRIHAVGALKPYLHRPTLDINTFGLQPRQYLLEQGFIATEFEQIYADVSEHALQCVAHCFERTGETPILRLHGDIYPSNILWSEAGPHFVDFDDSRMGVAVQDLWMLVSGNQQEMSWQMSHLLTGYQMFYDFNRNELSLLEALRTLRLIHYSAWLAKRWDDPAFPRAFPWFNTIRYWQDRVLELREQIALMEDLESGLML